jgi:hypothetical protein
MLYLKYFKLEVPESILILEDSKAFSIDKNNHYVIEKLNDDTFCFRYINREPAGEFARYSEFDLYRMFFDTVIGVKYREYSLEKYNNLKDFL